MLNEMKSMNRTIFRSWYNWWTIIISLFMFTLAIIFVQSQMIPFIIIGVLLLVITPFQVIISIKSHLKILRYINYNDDYKKKTKVINITAVVTSFIFVFCITYFGGRELGYANAFSAVLLIPLYRTEKTAAIQAKEELDSKIDSYND